MIKQTTLSQILALVCVALFSLALIAAPLLAPNGALAQQADHAKKQQALALFVKLLKEDNPGTKLSEFIPDLETYIRQNNDPDIKGTLAMLYYMGEDGVTQDSKRAYALAKDAAQQHNIIGYYMLGTMYYIGDNTLPQDLTKAHAWLALTLQHPDLYLAEDPAQIMLKDIEQQLSPSEKTQAKELAARCKSTDYKECL